MLSAFRSALTATASGSPSLILGRAFRRPILSESDKWGERRELNPQPQDPQSCALTRLSYAHHEKYLVRFTPLRTSSVECCRGDFVISSERALTMKNILFALHRSGLRPSSAVGEILSSPPNALTMKNINERVVKSRCHRGWQYTSTTVSENTFDFACAVEYQKKAVQAKRNSIALSLSQFPGRLSAASLQTKNLNASLHLLRSPA